LADGLIRHEHLRNPPTEKKFEVENKEERKRRKKEILMKIEISDTY